MNPKHLHLLAAAALGVCGAMVASSGSAAAPEIRAVAFVVQGPSWLDGFSRPVGLAADTTRGIVVVADTGKHRLVLFDASGRSRGCLPCQASSPTADCEPRAVAFDTHGRLYVIDAMRRDVEVLTSTGARLARFDPASNQPAGARPQSLAVGASGRIYLVYAGEASGLLVVEPKGPVVLEVGFGPDSPFRGPVGIAVNADESRIAVVDPEAERAVLVFGADGKLQQSFGTHGEGDGTFSMATNVAWGPDGTLWVTDTIRHAIEVFDAEGHFLSRFGGFGDAPGELNYPSACTFVAADRVAVLERAGARLQVFEMDGVGTRPLDAGVVRSVPETPELSTVRR